MSQSVANLNPAMIFFPKFWFEKFSVAQASRLCIR